MGARLQSISRFADIQHTDHMVTHAKQKPTHVRGPWLASAQHPPFLAPLYLPLVRRIERRRERACAIPPPSNKSILTRRVAKLVRRLRLARFLRGRQLDAASARSVHLFNNQFIFFSLSNLNYQSRSVAHLLAIRRISPALSVTFVLVAILLFDWLLFNSRLEQRTS